MLISIIIPCYNEEKRIGNTLVAVADYIQNLPKEFPHEFEVIVVDNGSKDRTQKRALAFKEVLPNLRILTENSHGKGWAVRQGMLAAHGDYRLFTDADNSTEIHYLEKLLKYAEEGYDVVASSRKLPLSHIMYRQPWYREALGNIFAMIARTIVPLGIKDTQNGFKLFTKEAAEKIFPHQSTFYWAFDVEILAIAQKLGFKTKEVPITWVNDEQSKVHVKGMIGMLFEVVAIRIHLWTREYVKKEEKGRKIAVATASHRAQSNHIAHTSHAHARAH